MKKTRVKKYPKIPNRKIQHYYPTQTWIATPYLPDATPSESDKPYPQGTAYHTNFTLRLVR